MRRDVKALRADLSVVRDSVLTNGSRLATIERRLSHIEGTTCELVAVETL